MKLKFVLYCLVVTLHPAQCQECRLVSICDVEQNPSSTARNLTTGNTGRRDENDKKGVPGQEASPETTRAPVVAGAQRLNEGSPTTDDLDHFQQEIRNQVAEFNQTLWSVISDLKAANAEIAHLLKPKSCLHSEQDGVRILRSGEKVYCYKRWRVIQRRFSGQVIFHNRTWNEYKNGFGSLSTEFWIGLEKIHLLTQYSRCQLRIELGAYDGNEAWAEYREFSIGSESDLFRLHLHRYSGTAGNAMRSRSSDNENMPFTTIDRDNDRHDFANCAECCGGAWWHKRCGQAKLNGPWGRDRDRNSLTWYTWKRSNPLKSSMMIIRCDQ